MPGASDIGSSFGLKKGGTKKSFGIVEVGAAEPEPAASSPKETLTKSLGAEARELLTGGSGDAVEAKPKKAGIGMISEVSDTPAPKKEQPRKMIISELTSSDEEDDAPPEDSQAPAASGPAGVLSSTTKAEFVPCVSFSGARAGYVFKLGAKGTGYYLDGSDASKADISSAARKVSDTKADALTAQASKGVKKAKGDKNFERASLDEISAMAKASKTVGKAKSETLEVLEATVTRDGDTVVVSIKMPGRRNSKGVMLAVSGTDLYSDLTLRAEQYEQLRVQLPAVVDQDKVKAKFSKRSSTLNVILSVVGEGDRETADSIMAKKAKKAKAKKRAAGVTKASEEAQKEKEKVKIDDLKFCNKCQGQGTFIDEQDIMGGLTGEKFTGLQRVITTECTECKGEGYINTKKLREERRKKNGGKDPEPDIEEPAPAKLGLNEDAAQVYADYKKNMDPEKRKDFEAKLAEARNAGAKPI